MTDVSPLYQKLTTAKGEPSESDPFDFDYLRVFQQVEVNDRPRAYYFASVFVSNLRKRSGDHREHSEQDELEQLTEFFKNSNNNFAWWRPFNYIVLSEQPVVLDSVLFKLESGLNMDTHIRFSINDWIERTSPHGFAGREIVRKFYREPHETA